MDFQARSGGGSPRSRLLGSMLAASLTALVFAASAGTASAASYGAMSWGENLFRQLGDGSAEALRTLPVPVSGLSGVSAVAGGQHHSVALLSNGTVVAWGSNELGQLGNGTNTTSNVPVAVSGLSGVTAIAAGANHSLALLSNGTVVAWGADDSGQLGDGTAKEASQVPITVKGLTGVRAIAAGDEFSLALLGNGTVMAWGNDEDGQLGNGTTKERSAVPVAVKGLSGVSAIAAGAQHALAVVSGGAVMAWGSNEYGQLADESVEVASNVPVAASGVTGASAVSAGSEFSLALLADGTVMAWGEDKFGELGNGATTADDEVPAVIGGLSGVTAIAAGGDHALALLAGGTVEAWGDGQWGELGNGTSGAASAVPVAVKGLSEVAGISAGESHSLAYGEPLPTITAVSPGIGPTLGGTSVTITGANLAGATAVRFGASSASSFAVGPEGSVTAVSPAGAGTVDVSVTTQAGTSPPMAADRFTYAAPPSVTKLSPSSGSAGGGTTVTITGTSFQGATAVSFGATAAASFSVRSATTITAVAPQAAAGTLDVRFTTPIGTSATSTHDRYRFTPRVTGVSPNAGSVAGGATVTITGAGFGLGSSATVIKFGTVRAKGVSCSSSTTCTALSPAHGAGTVDVTAVVNKVGSPKVGVADQFTYS